jgi:ketosteroid isomerase-like protein
MEVWMQGEHDGGDQERAAAWARLFSEAWAEGNFERLLAVLAPDARVLYPPMPEATDREGLRQFFERAYVRMPDLRFRLVDWAARGDAVFVEWVATATIGDQRLSWEGADRFTFGDDGQIVEARAYYDPRALLAALQAGAGAG